MAYYMASMGMDAMKAAAAQKMSEKEDLIERFEESLNGTGRLFQGRRSVLDEYDIEEVWSIKIGSFDD